MSSAVQDYGVLGCFPKPQEHWHAAQGDSVQDEDSRLQPWPCSFSGWWLHLTVASASCLSPESS